ncbi:hypothetical protein [Tropicimonas isoalkanivorans]|uniref:Uncharacterized protein n=1 Tax=Tropicimonas isoalkanivorans TaxID=441112 RepID=A0A1I1QDR1_9RHOB|nr:hypothetical protein [Tropicimonas isoalkanivorans]SFD20304.1 hypothetical protein SAMN04488094_12017 [Tropicimonas isoalkanivorans]
MTGQSRGVEDILMERLRTTQDIAAANVEHLRLSQIASGLMVLDMKAEEDGTSDEESDAKRRETYQALERCMEEVQRLEARLSSLDAELTSVTRGDDA